MNDSQAGGSDSGRTSSKLGSSRLVSAVSRAVAHAEERRGFAWRGCWAFNARGEARASSAAAAAATCRLLARSASPRPAPSLRLLRGAPRRLLSSLVLCLSSARAQFGSCGLLLLASAGLLGVQRPGCVLARGAAPRPAPSLRLPRVAASSFCSACFRCGQRARCAFCVPSPFFLKNSRIKKYCAGCIRRGVLAKPSPPKAHACPVNPLKAVELFYLHPPVRRRRN